MAKPKELSITQQRWLARIRATGRVRFDLTETGGDHFFFDSGQLVPARTVRALIAAGLLRPIGDALFRGMSQSYEPH